jgi:hypothetical protein
MKVEVRGRMAAKLMRLCLGIGCSCLLAPAVIPTADAQSPPQQMIKHSIAATESDWKASPHFTYVERDVDLKGGNRICKTYTVLVIDGSPYNRLIAIGDKPLSAEEQAREGEKLRKEIARRANESPAECSKRLAEYQKSRQRMFTLVEEMANAFDYRFIDEEELEGHPVHVFEALPRPGYQPRSREARVLTGMKGKLWIEKDTCRWVKVEAEAFKPVWLGYFIAQISPGTHFMLEQSPVVDNLWLPDQFNVQANVKIFGLKKTYVHDETYSEYRTIFGSSARENASSARILATLHSGQ